MKDSIAGDKPAVGRLKRTGSHAESQRIQYELIRPALDSPASQIA